MPRTRKPFILTGVVGGPILISLIALVAIVLQPTSDSGAQATHKLFVPAAGCDSCEPQPVRLYYLGMRPKNLGAPIDELGVRNALWDASDPRLLAEGPDAPDANVGVAWSVITPDQESAYLEPHGTSIQGCDNILWHIGYPTRQDGRRLVVFIDVAQDDPVAIQLGRALNKQWLRCEAGLELVLHPRAEFDQLVASGESEAFITSIDATTSKPFELMHRLFELDSPDNYTDVEPSDPASSIQPLLAAARTTTDPAAAELIYRLVNQRLFGFVSADYRYVLPLVWQYDFNGYQPPRVTIEGRASLLLNGFTDTLTISATVQPGRPSANIRAVTIDWGDGTRETVDLPASHKYAPVTKSTQKIIIVSARQSDGTVTWRARWAGHYPP